MTGSISEHPVHPLGSRARVLLASTFGPYAQDDPYGSRLINPMEPARAPGSARTSMAATISESPRSRPARWERARRRR